MSGLYVERLKELQSADVPHVAVKETVYGVAEGVVEARARNPLAVDRGYRRHKALSSDLLRYYESCRDTPSAKRFSGQRRKEYCAAVAWKRVKDAGRYPDYPAFRKNNPMAAKKTSGKKGKSTGKKPAGKSKSKPSTISSPVRVTAKLETSKAAKKQIAKASKPAKAKASPKKATKKPAGKKPAKKPSAKKPAAAAKKSASPKKATSKPAHKKPSAKKKPTHKPIVAKAKIDQADLNRAVATAVVEVEAKMRAASKKSKAAKKAKTAKKKAAPHKAATPQKEKKAMAAKKQSKSGSKGKKTKKQKAAEKGARTKALKHEKAVKAGIKAAKTRKANEKKAKAAKKGKKPAKAKAAKKPAKKKPAAASKKNKGAKKAASTKGKKKNKSKSPKRIPAKATVVANRTQMVPAHIKIQLQGLQQPAKKKPAKKNKGGAGHSTALAKAAEAGMLHGRHHGHGMAREANPISGFGEYLAAGGTFVLSFVVVNGLARFLATTAPTGTTKVPVSNLTMVLAKPSLMSSLIQGGIVLASWGGAHFIRVDPSRPGAAGIAKAAVQSVGFASLVHLGAQWAIHLLAKMMKTNTFIQRIYPDVLAADAVVDAANTAVAANPNAQAAPPPANPTLSGPPRTMAAIRHRVIFAAAPRAAAPAAPATVAAPAAAAAPAGVVGKVGEGDCQCGSKGGGGGGTNPLGPAPCGLTSEADVVQGAMDAVARDQDCPPETIAIDPPQVANPPPPMPTNVSAPPFNPYGFMGSPDSPAEAAE